MKLAIQRPSVVENLMGYLDLSHPYFQLMTLLATLVLLVGITVSHIYIQYQNRLLSDRAIGAQIELSDLAALVHEIQLEEQGLNRYDRIKLIATKRLDLADVNSSQIVTE